MVKKRNIHVVPHKNGWALKRVGAKRASKVFETKSPVLEAGKKLAKKDQVELVIHKKDGTIKDSDSYGNDPNPPKDKKH